jgi:hypothetical protein
MIHHQTANISFLKMYKILKELGIQDNAFFLELNNPELALINPRSDNLTRREVIMILKEVQENPWYFIREIVVIPSSGVSVPFELNRGNLAIIWALLNNISAITVLPRQTGKTFATCAIYVWLFYFGTKNTSFTLFSYSDQTLQANLQRIKDIRDSLPKYLNLYDARTDKDNTREMRFENNGNVNYLRVKAPGTSEEASMKAGRGLSTPCIFFDEIAFTPHIQAIYESSVFAYKTPAEIAKKNNSYYHRIMMTSAGHLDSKSGQWCFNFINNCCDFEEKMYDLDKKHLIEVINKNSTNGFVYITFMYYDLSREENFIENMRKDSVSDDAFRREVLNSWEKTSEDHPLGKELVASLTNYISKPADTIVIDDVYFLKLYKPIEDIDFGKTLVGGVDCGGNLLNDFSTLVIVDPENFEVLGTLRTNSHSTNRFAKCLVHVMLQVFTGLVLVPERNNMGIAILDYILDNFPQLKYRIYHDESEKPGFATTNKTRPLLFNSLLKVIVVEDYMKLHDRHIIFEIMGLKVGRNGRIDHDANGHDDTLIAYLFTRWFFTYAKNKDKYINSLLIGRIVNTDELTLNEKIRPYSKGAFMNNNFKSLLLGENYTENMVDATGKFTKAMTDPNYVMRTAEVNARNASVASNVEKSFNLIAERYKNRQEPLAGKRDFEVLDDSLEENEEYYDETPDKIREKTIDNKKRVTAFKTDLSMTKQEEIPNKFTNLKKLLFS